MTALTVYFTSTNDSVVTTARDLAITGPSGITTVSSGQYAKSATGFSEIFSQGGNATLAATEPTPSDHGFILPTSTLNLSGKTIAAGTWTIHLDIGAVATGFTATPIVRIWKRNGSTYTQFTSGGVAAEIDGANAAVPTIVTGITFSGSLDSMAFATGDQLYVDVLWNITTGSSNNTATNRVLKFSENSGATESIVTPGYSVVQTVGLTAALSSTGSIVKTVQQAPLSGSVSLSGTFIKAITQSPLIAVLSFVGSLIVGKLRNLALNATLSLSGNVRNIIARLLSGGFNFAGSIRNATTKRVTSTLSSNGLIQRSLQKILFASVSFVGNVTKAMTTKLRAGLNLVGTLNRGLVKVLLLTGALRFSGFWNGVKRLGGQAYTLAVAGTLAMVGGIKFVAAKTLIGALRFTGISQATMQRLYTATLGLTGTVRRNTVHILNSMLSFTSQKATVIRRALTATLTPDGTLSLGALKSMVLKASLNFAGATSRTVGKSAQASISFVGRTNQTVMQSLTAALSFVSISQSAIRSRFQTVLALTATLTPYANRVLALRASLSVRGNLVNRYIARQVNMMRERTNVIQRTGKNNIREFRIATKKAVAWRRK